VAAVVLAAGRSQRMGASNKLLERLDGKPLVCHTVDELLQTGVRPIVVVTGHQSENVRAALSGRQVVFVENPQFADGLSSSLRVCLGDMPKVRREHIESLLGAFEPSDGREIIVPTFAGRRGNPVLWAARYFPMMKELSGDLGARELQKRFVDRVCLVPMPDDAVTIDVDTKEALDSLRSVGA
jgi:molybdenum cofactor cytidylyltransferase